MAEKIFMGQVIEKKGTEQIKLSKDLYGAGQQLDGFDIAAEAKKEQGTTQIETSS